MFINKKLWEAVQLSGKRRYVLARAAKIHPTTLSQILNNMRPVHRDDPRIMRLGRLLGLKPDELFDEEDKK